MICWNHRHEACSSISRECTLSSKSDFEMALQLTCGARRSLISYFLTVLRLVFGMLPRFRILSLWLVFEFWLQSNPHNLSHSFFTHNPSSGGYILIHFACHFVTYASWGMPARNLAALMDVLLACSYSSILQLTSRTSFSQNSACSSPTEADGLWFVICFSFWTMSTPGVVGLRALTYKNFEESDTIPERSHMKSVDVWSDSHLLRDGE